MAVSGRVNHRKEQTHKRIIESAMRLFLEQGFEEATVAQITDNANIGKGTFLHIFPPNRTYFRFLANKSYL